MVALLIVVPNVVMPTQVDVITDRLQRAADLIRQGELGRAEAQLNVVFKREPREANALNLLGVIRAQQRRLHEAERLFLSAIEVNKSLLGAYLNIGQLYLDQKKTDQALWAFTQAEKLQATQPGNGPSFTLLFNLGATWLQKGQRRRAEEFFLAALKIEPDDVPTLLALANIARLDAELEKALSYLVRARKIAPNSSAVLYDFGWTALNMNLIYDAASALEQLRRLDVANREYLYPLAIARLNNGQKREAESLINQYIQFRPRDGRGYYVLGAILYADRRFVEARNQFKRSLILMSYPDTKYYLGMIAYAEGDAEQAISWFRDALQSDPMNAATHTALGTALGRKKEYQAARASLERAIALDPKNQVAHYQLGLVYARLGERDRSREMFAIAERLRSEQKDQEGVGIRLIDLPK
jgi:tetratricopeptide (TPR) repeat protein